MTSPRGIVDTTAIADDYIEVMFWKVDLLVALELGWKGGGGECK